MIGPVTFDPLIPAWLLAVLATLAAAIAAAGVARRARGAALRALGLLFLVLVLAGPRWRERTTAPLPDIAVIVRDRSSSMAIGDREHLADAAFHHLVHTLPKSTRLVVASVAGNGHDGTPFFAVLRDALSSIPPKRLAGVVAISDGEVTDKPIPLPSNVPVSALIPARGNQTDRALALIDAPHYGLVGHHVVLRFAVSDHGMDDRGMKVPVQISIDGKTVARLQAPADRPVSVKLPVTHEGGSVVTIAAAELPGEVSAVNDQAVFTLTGVRRRLTVLLVAGGPNPGLRTWRLLLKSDPAVRLANFTILRLPSEALAAPVHDMSLIPFPVDQLFNRDLGRFDLIILDQFSNNGLLLPPYLANIAAHVRAGGALLIEAGPEFEGPASLADSPLEPILPALPDGAGTVTGGFTPAFTATGRRHPVTAPLMHAAMAPWYRFESARRVRGVILLRTPGADGGAPLLVLAHEGKGRVAMLLSDQYWLWARGALAHDEAMAGPAEPLLRRTVHWLLGEPALAASRLTAHIAGGRLTVERRSLKGGAPGSAQVTDPSGKSTTLALHRIAPGRFTASIPAGAAGVWRVSAGGMTAYAGAANDDPAEYADLAASDRIFAPLARRSGGRIVWLGRTPKPGWGGLLHRRRARLVTGARDIPLLPALPAAILAFVLIALAWWRER
ncbi:hypothetical protein [Acidiphilium iwatense]|uniref:hypothetical protein n=1 Tax=Acidiphilium iwatense TaxID=768198 RepID=UPI001F4435F2|nr:hypothetical protein [Acidiphilium iwatense]